MGYYTQFSVEINPESQAIREIMEADDALYGLDNGGGSYKWYGHEEDMRAFSKNFPEHVFELSGEGEETGDMWRKYFKDGKMQHCPAIITYEPFDESKLQ